jgi:hypothetical protein
MIASSFLVAGVYSGNLKNAGLKWLNKKGSISRLQYTEQRKIEAKRMAENRLTALSFHLE